MYTTAPAATLTPYSTNGGATSMTTTSNDKETMVHFGWNPGFWEHLNNEVIAKEAACTRKVRPLLPPFGDSHTKWDQIPVYQIDESSGVATIPRRLNLLSVEISYEFRLRAGEDIKDEGRVEFLARRAANHVALASDAVTLFGASEFARKELAALKVQHHDLDCHTGLFRDAPTKVSSILDSILLGIQELLEAGHYGDYTAIVAPDLYVQAMKCHESSCDAPIMQIRPLLGEHGSFVSSRSVPHGAGVLLSPRGGALDIAVPWPACLGFVSPGEYITLKVFEKMALRINDSTAVVPLKNSVIK